MWVGRRGKAPPLPGQSGRANEPGVEAGAVKRGRCRIPSPATQLLCKRADDITPSNLACFSVPPRSSPEQSSFGFKERLTSDGRKLAPSPAAAPRHKPPVCGRDQRGSAEADTGLTQQRRNSAPVAGGRMKACRRPGSGADARLIVAPRRDGRAGRRPRKFSTGDRRSFCLEGA